MKIAFFGDGPWAHKALRAIKADSNDVAIVVVRNDAPDQELISIAKELGIKFTSNKNVNEPEFIAELKALDADLGVSMSFNQIIRSELIELFPKKFINCHAGKLPEYRGRNILNWALINDEKEIGVTCHFIDEGVDTGDIIMQKTFAVNDTDDYASVL